AAFSNNKQQAYPASSAPHSADISSKHTGALTPCYRPQNHLPTLHRTPRSCLLTTTGKSPKAYNTE
ncbi:hypothetical protein IscW_ISCW009653, partial [Ixodes scapularis]